MFADLQLNINLGESLVPVRGYLTRPYRLLREYNRINIRPDLIAGLTVAVILLPQAIAFALIAELPPQMGIYTAFIAAVVAGLWGSSHQTHTGPANAHSLLVLSILVSNFIPGSPEFILAAGMLAIMSGIFQLGLGLARLGMLVNFVSHSVIIGFATGAGLLIAIRQLPYLFGIEVEGENVGVFLLGIGSGLTETNLITAALGIGTIVLIVLFRHINKRLPGPLIAMVMASLIVFVLNLEELGVAVIGELPQSLPPLADLPLLNLGFINRLSTGALAVAAIGLVETTAISRSIASQTGQRLDSNQEFVGQGLANITVGLFSGFPCAGSFSRSAVNLDAGARTSISSVFSALFLLIAVFATAPMARYLPRAALAGVLIVVAIGMINHKEIVRIWQGTKGDALIMLVTFIGTLFLDIAFAILVGILISFALYLWRTSVPRVNQVVPDEQYKHFAYQKGKPVCPQLGVIDILGDLYFGAVNHVEETIYQYMEENPSQRYLLIRMHNVNHCDFSGIHMLESVVRAYREKGGDIFLVRVDNRVNNLMTSTGFCDRLGWQNFLTEDLAVSHIFYKYLDPAVCIYECPVKVFKECQNLPKQLYLEDIPVLDKELLIEPVLEIKAMRLWEELRTNGKNIIIVDVREPREYHRGHIPNAMMVPLPKILTGQYEFDLNSNHQFVFVCRSGRRSRRAARLLMNDHQNIRILSGGMLAWEAEGLLEAVD